ncbi:hypothetical protein BH11PLA2_BH11PLA2_20590 [soil metagenome]
MDCSVAVTGLEPTLPIDLTTVPEGGGSQQRRRRRRHKQKKHVGLAIAGGIFVLALFGGGFYLVNHTGVLNNIGPGTNSPSNVVPGDPVSVEKISKPSTVISAPAVSSGELPAELAKARIVGVRRVIGADGTTDLQVEYAFLEKAKAPREFVLTIKSPAGIVPAGFTRDSARADTIRLGQTLQRIGSKGPIEVWIETLYGHERVSNVMTIP